MPLSAEARDERAVWLRLVLTPGIGPASVRRLLEAFGLPEDIFAAGRAKLAAALDGARAQALLVADESRDAQIRATLDWADDDRHHLVALTDPLYPPRLLAIGDPPALLFVRGDPTALSRASLAIVGSRHATRAGVDHAQAFARALADSGLQICSGLAQGIDAAAHRGALAGRAGTLAVVGTGVDLVYPAGHAALADAIAARGAVVSELPLGMQAQRANFPRRNRLIAGLSLGVLVVEAARHSGSLITARQAAEFGREVMAIPGSIHSPVSKGCHQLIRDGAKLVESAEDVLVELRAQMGEAAAPSRGQAPATAPSRGEASAGRPPWAPPGAAAAALLAELGWDPADPDALAERTGQPIAAVSAGLLELELAGLAERWVDGRYVRAGR
ncbi:MAG: DNA-protecting protein DprA [Burkholderiales bacterium]|nr:MAG: DNA-protecting protein DprA [Burkholderiales bacterium]